MIAKIKTFSLKLTLIIMAMVIVVAGAVAGYYQVRVLQEIGNHMHMTLRYQATAKALRFEGTAVEEMEPLLNGFRAFDTGFAILLDDEGAFWETHNTITRLSNAERNLLASFASDDANHILNLNVGGVDYYITAASFADGKTIFIMVPGTEVNAEATTSLSRFPFIFLAAFVIVGSASRFIGKKVTKPITALSRFMKKIAATGNISYETGEKEELQLYSQNADEIGEMIRNSGEFVDAILSKSNEVERIANNDLTIDAAMISEDDAMGSSLQKMISSLNNAFSEINSAGAKVASNSRQIAAGAATLAQGATEQAATVEELSATITEIASKASANAEMTGRASSLAVTIKGNAEKGNAHMNDMMDAVQEINQASHNISKVIKVIEDIAFQTNILALNAAVEAARAGQHGKGFAVVADEVRSLAAKSAEAAKDTGLLITSSIETAERGTRIAEETAVSLSEIVAGINDSSAIVSEIAAANEEQAGGISMIHSGIAQITDVVSQNSAMAEESAAASQELSEQSKLLEELISQFKLKDDYQSLPETTEEMHFKPYD